MAVLGGFLGGLGLIGLLVAGLLALVALLVLPAWAMLDCVLSRREGGSKAGLLLVLLFTWGVGSLVYGLFATRSRLLRLATVVFLFVFAAVLVPSLASLVVGAGISQQLTADRQGEEDRALAAQFSPAEMPIGEIGAYAALHWTYDRFGVATSAVARFDGDAPNSSARDVDSAVRQVAMDPVTGRYWAVTVHEFGFVRPEDGRFEKVDIGPAAKDFAWAAGVAFDPTDRRIFVAASHVYTTFYRYDPASRSWTKLPAEFRDLPIAGLTYLPANGCLYALELAAGDRALRRVHRFNVEGASLGAIELRPAIPVASGPDARVQLQATERDLIVIATPLPRGQSRAAGGATRSRLFVIDTQDGQVRVPATR